jgi:hypothetical protein
MPGKIKKKPLLVKEKKPLLVKKKKPILVKEKKAGTAFLKKSRSKTAFPFFSSPK